MPTSRSPLAIALLAVLFLLSAAAVPAPTATITAGPAVTALQPEPIRALPLPKAIALGVIEGVTEFLPVSSTGHLAVAERLLGIGRTPAEKRAADSYAIVIQGGAILAVLLVSLGRIRAMLRGIVGKDRDGLRLLVNLAVAFVPAAVIGLATESLRARLFGTWPIVCAWIVGGLAILALIRARSIGVRGGVAAPEPAGRPLESLAWRQALLIGVAQAVAIWPGVSRSLVTIVAAMLIGLSVPAAVEFSFLLGLVTLGAATGYEAVKSGDEIIASFGIVMPLVGFVVAAVFAFLSVRWMVGWLKKHSLSVFGWYRIGLGVVVGALAIAGFA